MEANAQQLPHRPCRLGALTQGDVLQSTASESEGVLESELETDSLALDEELTVVELVSLTGATAGARLGAGVTGLEAGGLDGAGALVDSE